MIGQIYFLSKQAPLVKERAPAQPATQALL